MDCFCSKGEQVKLMGLRSKSRAELSRAEESEAKLNRRLATLQRKECYSVAFGGHYQRGRHSQ